MLRAIGAQIEKTTNREACRDLSGRRLRDINEEKRLKSWIAAQADREREAEDRKQQKIERLCRKPKHEFKDEVYDKERSSLPEKVEDAVSQGFLKASCSKRGNEEVGGGVKKKAKLWVDDLDEEDLSSDEDSESSKGKSKSEEDNDEKCENQGERNIEEDSLKVEDAIRAENSPEDNLIKVQGDSTKEGLINKGET